MCLVFKELVTIYVWQVIIVSQIHLFHLERIKKNFNCHVTYILDTDNIY